MPPMALPPDLLHFFEEAAKNGSGTVDPQSLSYMRMAISASSHAYSSPIPPAEIAQAWENVVPGSAERMLAMAERQAAHRQRLESVAVEGGTKRSWYGLWLGFSIAVLFLIGCLVIIALGYGVEGTILGSIDIVGLSGVFVYARVDQRRERTEKSKEVAQTTTGSQDNR
jgi:uncharacterized membrane protein